ncbi:MAG: ATP-binding protein [bacterium]|nr:ATP-binding protein [bacterium]
MRNSNTDRPNRLKQSARQTGFVRTLIALSICAGLLFSSAVACGDANETETPRDLHGAWSLQPGLDRPDAKPADADAAPTIVDIPAVVADFIEDPAGQWQLLCRDLPADLAARVRAGESIVWHTGHVSDVSRFFVNDIQVGGIGSLPPQYAGGHMRARQIAIPHTALQAPSQGADRLCMALWSAGGFRAAVRSPGPYIGEAAAVYTEFYRDRILTQMMLGIYTIIGLYHLFLFLRGRKHVYDLYFAGLCMSVTLYFFLAAPSFREFFSGELAVLRLKIEFATLTVLAPLALLFIEQLLRGRNPPFVGALLVGMASPWPLIAIGEVSTIHYSLLLIHLVMLGTLLYLIYRVLREAMSGNRDARLLFIGTLGFIFAVLHDVLLSHQILGTPPIASIAFAVLLPAFATMLANRFLRIQERVQDLNRNLEERVEERTADLEQARLRAEDASRAKSRFLAAMSHEIRTPLQAMLGASDLLVGTESRSERENLARMLDQAGENLSTLIEDTLDLARIEADRIELQPRPLALHELIQGTASILKIKADAKDLELRVEIEADVPARILGDPGRLSQILLNLAGNAVKFTDRGEVRIHTRMLPPSISEKHPQTSLRKTLVEEILQIEVRDTGPGIAPDDRARIFEAFEQGPDFISRKQSGAGLGLAISSRLAQLMHGDISVDSHPGRGSSFFLTLPVRRIESQTGEAEPGKIAAREDDQSESPARILIAEDNPDIRQLLAIYVKTKPWIVSFAENGREAIERIKSLEAGQAFDLLILDMQMPVLDGESTARILRRWEARSGREPALILAFTAHAMFQEREQILSAGCDALIAKPIVKKDFLAVVSRTLQERPAGAGRKDHS